MEVSYLLLDWIQQTDSSVTLFGSSLYLRTVHPRPIASEAIKQFLFPHPPSLFFLPDLSFAHGRGFRVQVPGYKLDHYNSELKVPCLGLIDRTVVAAETTRSSRYISSRLESRSDVDLGPTSGVQAGLKENNPFRS